MSEFWKALAEFKEPEPIDLEYRLYYNIDDGVLICATTDDLDGDYLVISKDQFENISLHNYRINEGVLKEIDRDNVPCLMLEQSNDGEFCTLPNNMIFVSDEGDHYRTKT